MVALLAGVEPDPAALTLRWTAPPQCPQQGEIDARMIERLRDGVSITAEGAITEQPGAQLPWRLVMRVQVGSGEPGERVLEAHDCAALADAAVLVLAVAASSAASTPGVADIPPPPVVHARPQPAPIRASSPAPASAAPLERTAAPAAEAVPSTRRRVAAELAVAGGFDAVAMPGLGGSVTASIGVRIAWLGVHAFALHGIRRDVDAQDVEARHWLTSGGLALCGLAEVRSFELGGCAKGELGGLSSKGIRGKDLDDSTELWAAVSLGAHARWRFARRWALALSADAVAPLAPVRFRIGEAEVGRTGIVGVRLLAGLVVRLGPRDSVEDPGNRGSR